MKKLNLFFAHLLSFILSVHARESVGRDVGDGDRARGHPEPDLRPPTVCQYNYLYDDVFHNVIMF